MIIKVCGMRDAENIRQLDEANIADWIGFIFYRKSSRYIDSLPSYMPQNSKRVGVFVNEPIEGIIERVKTFRLDMVQLHGNEDIAYIDTLRKALGAKVKIIKTIQVERIEDLAQTSLCFDLVDYLLFETKCYSYGGSGKQFDWNILQSYQGNTPFLITGGISPDDADKILAFHHSQFAGIDLNSRFEASPAVKDMELLRKFITLIK